MTDRVSMDNQDITGLESKPIVPPLALNQKLIPAPTQNFNSSRAWKHTTIKKTQLNGRKLKPLSQGNSQISHNHKEAKDDHNSSVVVSTASKRRKAIAVN